MRVVQSKPSAKAPIKSKKSTAAKPVRKPGRDKSMGTSGPLVISQTKGTRRAVITAGSVRVNPKRVDDLKGASYNPRVITEAQMRKLKLSYEEFGDLSGVTFNVASGVLISGHQRLKTVKGKPSKIVKTKTADKRGTVSVGHIEVTEKDGSVTRIPYREVNWNDKLTEMAANVAANAHGGSFDDIKLGKIMTKLEEGQFDIETTGVHELDFRKTVIKARNDSGSGASTGTPSGSGSSKSSKSSGGEFQTVGRGDVEDTKCRCPRCGFRFDPS